MTYRLRYTNDGLGSEYGRTLEPRFTELWRAVDWALSNRLGMPSGVYSVIPTAIVEVVRED